MDRKVTFYSEGVPCVGILGIPDDYKAGEKRRTGERAKKSLGV